MQSQFFTLSNGVSVWFEDVETSEPCADSGAIVERVGQIVIADYLSFLSLSEAYDSLPFNVFAEILEGIQRWADTNEDIDRVARSDSSALYSSIRSANLRSRF